MSGDKLFKEEQEKYDLAWSTPWYRIVNHGLQFLQTQLVARPEFKEARAVIDFGCGNGRTIPWLLQQGKRAMGVDISTKSVDKELLEQYKDHYFLGVPFWDEAAFVDPLVDWFEFGISADVLEHIPPEKVEQTIQNMQRIAPVCAHKIALFNHSADVRNAENKPLDFHLTVKPAEWWNDTFIRLGYQVEVLPTTAPYFTLIAKGSEDD